MSVTFAERVLEAGKALLVKNARKLSRDEQIQSVGFQDVDCIIGVPITLHGVIISVILGDNLEKPGLLTEEHLRLMQFAGRVIEVLYQKDSVGKLDDMLRSLPVCDVCKKVRDDQGYWTQLESFVSERVAVRLSRSCCPECAGAVAQS